MRAILGLLLSLFFPVLLAAQEFRGTILGRVTDTTGAVVPDAAVQATNADTGVVASTRSNADGNYQIPFLLPGDYTLTVEHTGFRKVDRSGVRVSTNTQVTLDIRLEVGDISELVTVRGEAPLLNMATPDLGQVVERSYIERVLVSASRNAVNLARLAPGVSGSTGTYTSNAQSEFSISGGGATRGRNEVMVDGIPNTVPRSGGVIVVVPSLDSVEEVKIHTTMFDAAYGHTNGGAINITTRGGTNQLRGVVYDYKRFRDLNANTWTNNRLGLPKPPVDYNQWGYMVGGPLHIPGVYDGRNRTFFTTSLERDADSRDLTRQARVPTEVERRGDFSQTVNRVGGPLSIFDPMTTVVSGGRATRQEFPGARIPPDRISPTGSAVMNAYPLPNLPGPSQIGRFNWASTAVYTVKQKQVSGRIDHVLSDRHRIFGRVTRLVRDQRSDTFFPGVFAFPAEGSSDLGVDLRYFTSVALDDTFTFSPTLVGSFRYGFSRRFTTARNGASGSDAADLRLPAGFVAEQSVKGYPIFRLGENLATIGTSASSEANDLHALLGTFTKLAGNHSLKVGVDYRLVRWNRRAGGGSAPGDFTFNPIFTQADPFTNSSADRSGTGMASLLLGAPASGSFGYTGGLSLQNHYLALFVQEDWKTHPRLTVSLGLRYDLETPYTERDNHTSFGFDPDVRLPVQVQGLDLRGGVMFAGVDGHPRRQGNIDWNNLAPRVGFAFNLTSKTVLRGGYGLFYSAQSYNTGFLGEVGVFNANTAYVGSIDNGATIFTTLANPFPSGLNRPVGSEAGLLAVVGDSLTYLDPKRVSPYAQQWQVSAQRELPARILLEAAYLGMTSRKQFESFDLNEKPDQFLALGAAENTGVTNPFLGVFPTTSTLGRGATVPQRRLWVRFPQFTTLRVEGANTGRADYHALQLRVEKRLTHGLSVLGSYTRSRLMDNNTTSIVNQRHYRSISEFDQPHLARMAFTYEVPLQAGGRGVRGVVRQVAGGWSIAGLWQVASGLPLSITHTNGRPVLVRDPHKSDPAADRLGDRLDASGQVLNPYFDVTAFAPLPNQYVVSPQVPFVDALREPGSRSLNLSLFKVVPLRNRVRLEIRADAINVTNTPNFGAPGTNMSNAATFGVITSAGGSRSMQIGTRLSF
jgi:hypothetical protein